MKTPLEQVNDFIQKHYEKEQDKRESGFGTNHFDEWDSFKSKWEEFLNGDQSRKQQDEIMFAEYRREIAKRDRILEQYGLKNKLI